MLENILFSMNSTMPLFFIMLLGYVLHRTGFLSDAFVAGATSSCFMWHCRCSCSATLAKTMSAPPSMAGMCCSALRSHWRASL